MFEAVFKGVGQVMFAGSTSSGVIMTLALAACSPIAAIMAVLGSSTSPPPPLHLSTNPN